MPIIAWRCHAWCVWSYCPVGGVVFTLFSVQDHDHRFWVDALQVKNEVFDFHFNPYLVVDVLLGCFPLLVFHNLDIA